MDQQDFLQPVPANIAEEEKRSLALSFLEEITGRKEMQTKTGTFASITERLVQLHALGESAQPDIDDYLDSINSDLASLFHQACDDLPEEEIKICSNEELNAITGRVVAALQICGADVEHYELTEENERRGGGWFKIRDGKPLVQYASFMSLVHETEHFLQWLEVNKKMHLLNRLSVAGDVAEAFAKLTKYYAFKQFGINRNMDAAIYRKGYETDVDFLKFQKEADSDTFIGIGLTTTLPLVVSDKKETDIT